MPRILRKPKDPEALGLAVLALRTYLSPPASPTATETEITAALNKVGLDRRVAKGLLANFDTIAKNTKKRYIGDLGIRDKLPEKIGKRQIAVTTRSQVEMPHPDLLNELRSRSPGAEFEMNRPRADEVVIPPIDYLITYEGMRCIDETHVDWIGSDSIYIVSSATHITNNGDNIVRTERHPLKDGQSGIYENVDSGNTRIGPQAAVWKGKVDEISLGMSLTTVVFEHDKGDPDAYKEEVDAAVKLAAALVSYLYPPSRAILAMVVTSGLVTDFINWLLGTGDDEIGTKTQVFKFSTLEGLSRSHIETYWYNKKPTSLKYRILADVNDWDYIVAYDVIRNPVAPPYEVVIE